MSDGQVTADACIRSSSASRPRSDPEPRIPRTIFQTFKTSHVTVRMLQAVTSWKEKNPEYSYEFFDDEAMYRLMADCDCADFSFDRDTLLRAFHRIRPGAGKADLFRYVLMYQRGGVYMDIDTVCQTPLAQYVRDDEDVVTGLGRRGDFHQWGLIYSPRHPFLRQAVEYSVANILHARFVAGYKNSLEGLSGPPCLHRAIRHVWGLRWRRRFKPGLYDLPIESKIYRIKILPGDCFDHHVGFKYQGYQQDLEAMGVTYWGKDRLFNEPAEGSARIEPRARFMSYLRRKIPLIDRLGAASDAVATRK